MWPPPASSYERRREPRRAAQARARLEPTDARPVSPVDVLIEERSGRGFRLRSESPLLEDAVVVLHPRGDPRPLQARIVWARRDDRGERRLSSAWRAGACLVQRETGPAGSSSRPPASAPETEGRALKVLVVGALLGLVALLVYAVVRFATLIGEGAASWTR